MKKELKEGGRAGRAVIKRRGPGISPGYYEGDPPLLS